MPLVYLGTALISAAVLLLQIALTRVFAIMLWHHFAYLVISIALLGYGAAGSWLARRGDKDRGSLALRAAAFAVSVAVALPVATLVGDMPPSFGLQNMDFGRLIALYAVILIALLGCGDPTSVEAGMASFYADSFHGRKTASGDSYDKGAMTAAHRTLPFDTRVKVTNLDNGRSAWVRINDRGPFVEGRIIDLSGAAARKLQMIETGTAKVRLEIYE